MKQRKNRTNESVDSQAESNWLAMYMYGLVKFSNAKKFLQS